MRKLCEMIEQELDRIADKGFTSTNLDTAYKLVDMCKDIKNMDYWERKGDYYDYVLAEMQGGYGERGRRRDSMGRYSRGSGMRRDEHYGRQDVYNDPMYDRYMSSKMAYRSGKTADGKRKLMDSIEEYMDDFTDKIKEMHRDADTPEEREMISKFINKLQNIR